MRLLLFSCLSIFLQASGMAFSSPSFLHRSKSDLFPHLDHAAFVAQPVSEKSALVLSVDSIHHVNCLRATGYLAVKATGGAQPYSYVWSNSNMGPVSTSLAPGVYEITVTDDNGTTATVSATILEDLVLPTADAGADFTATCANSVLTLNGSGSVGAEFKYLWTPANGGVIQSGATTLSPVIKHTGDFTLKVTNQSNGCTSTSAVIVSAANQPPVVTATGGVFTCAAPVVTLNSTFPVPNTVFVWNGPNGYVSNQLHPQVAVIGNYILKVTDTLSTCFNTATATVTADTTKPTAAPVGGLINCALPTLTISGAYTPLNATFNWSGPLGFNSTQQYPLVSAGGTYKVTVTNPTNGCTVTAAATVNSNFTPPTAFASTNGALSCMNNFIQLNGGGSPVGVITFSWTGPGGFTSTLQNPVISNPGIYNLTTKNPQNGCTAEAHVTVVLNNTPPGVTATGGVKTCANPTVTLQATSPTQGVSYLWTGPGGFNSTLQNPAVSATGTYTIVVTGTVNGCTSSTTVGVTQNTTPPNLTTTTATISCYTPGPHIVASSTTSGATFSWAGPNGFTSSIANPVVTVGGSYTATATNPANGCTASKTIFVDENLVTANVYAGEDRSLNCNFTSILANPIGTSVGVNYTYLWTTWDGNIANGSTILYARFDLPGHYTLAVKNAQSGCTVKDSMEVFQSPPLVASGMEVNSVSCNGGNNGSVKANASGGVTPYTYIWSNGSQTATVNNLSVGTYNVTVTDFEGCTTSTSANVTQPGVLVANVSTTPQTQVGVNNGTATVTPTGGSAPFTVKWSTGSTFMTIINLAPGAYTVTVTDSKGCTKSNTANVNATNCAVSGTVTATNLNCAGTSTGSATAMVTGAPAPITYFWSNGSQTQTANNLPAGNYLVTVTGSNGCSTVLSTQISGPQPLALSVVSSTNVLCAGLQNGAATVNASGGTSPYTYAWSNGNTGVAATNLASGTYSCTTTDAHGCSVTQNVQITSPAAISVSVLTKTDVPCIDGQSGSITLTATGGTAPFNYAWSNSGTGPTLNDLGTGNYLCTVTDANGCSKTSSAQIVATDNVAPQLILKNASVALGANGSVTVTPSQFDNGSFDQDCNIVNWTISPTSFNCGQLGAKTVTLTATDKNGNSATGTAIVTVLDNIAPVMTCPANQTASACASVVNFNPPQITDNCTVSGTATLVSGLASGATFPVGVTQQQYSYTDGGGNTATCQFTVTVSGNANVEPSAQPSSCSGNCDGSASLTTPGGGTPTGTIVWSNGQTGAMIVNLCPGNYSATLTDGSGCSQTYTAHVLVQDNQPPTLTCPSNIVAGYCNTAVTFAMPLVTDNCAVVTQQVQLIAGLPSGATFPIGLTTETFRYTDGGGNSAECSFTVTVHLAASVNSSTTNVTCAGACNGAATISVSGGQGPFGILWSNGSAGPSIANLCSGTYTATVTDADGCQQMQTAQISQPNPIALSNFNITHDVQHTGVGNITVSVSGGMMPYTYSWSLNGLFFSSTQNLFGLFSGEYVLVVTDARGCTFTSQPFVVSSSVATTSPEDELQWLMYPNPAQAEVFLKMNILKDLDTRVSIFDVSGVLLYDEDISPLHDVPVRIDLSGFPDGMLLVRLTNELGNFSRMLMKAQR